jgi:hypothetical protein
MTKSKSFLTFFQPSNENLNSYSKFVKTFRKKLSVVFADAKKLKKALLLFALFRCQFFFTTSLISVGQICFSFSHFWHQEETEGKDDLRAPTKKALHFADGRTKLR